MTNPNVRRVILSSSDIVHDFVTSKEGQSIGVCLEVLDNAERAGEVVGSVRAPWVGPVDALAREWGVDVDDHVDADSVEDTRALVVVDIGVNVVDTDGVDLISGSV